MHISEKFGTRITHLPFEDYKILRNWRETFDPSEIELLTKMLGKDKSNIIITRLEELAAEWMKTRVRVINVQQRHERELAKSVSNACQTLMVLLTEPIALDDSKVIIRNPNQYNFKSYFNRPAIDRNHFKSFLYEIDKDAKEYLSNKPNNTRVLDEDVKCLATDIGALLIKHGINKLGKSRNSQFYKILQVFMNLLGKDGRSAVDRLIQHAIDRLTIHEVT